MIGTMTEPPAALAPALRYLACPHCAAALTGPPVRCGNGHTFDVARHGYLTLLSGTHRPAGDGDTAGMVAARHDFLRAGHHSPITTALAEAATAAGTGCVLDLGAGTGHQLAAVLDALPGRTGIALDISRYALRRAARAHPRAAAIRADTWTTLPVRDGAVGLALNVFAPRNPTELRRVLAADGVLLVVTPTAAHLRELVGPLGLIGVDPGKQRRLDDTLGVVLGPADTRRIEYPMRLDHAAATAAVLMGPSARHLDPVVLAGRVAALPEPVEVTASATVSVYTA
jgi:23S rRNA (guanine745-N1)-methyltransferase